MALPQDCQALTAAFSGFGVDENLIISIAGKWNPEGTKSFRKGCSKFFSWDERHLFEKWESDYIAVIEREFAHFKKAVMLWTMHPWERDARMLKESLVKGPKLYNVIIEIACTRSSEELLGTRKAYHSIFHHSVEEDVVYHVTDTTRNLLVALVSAYRYEGPRVNEELAKSEANILGNAVRVTDDGVDLMKNEQVLGILSTRSKQFLRTVFKYYTQIYGKTVTEDLEHDLMLRETVACLCTPHAYFSKLLDMALEGGVDEHTSEALTRIVVCRADIDMKEIKEEYEKLYGVSLSEKIEETAYGNYKDFLLALISREH